MPSQRTKVKGIKFGTMSAYNAMSSHDPDMLYFITDKGLLYRGESIVVPRNYITTQVNNPASGQGEQYVTFTVETYGSGGQQGNTLTFDVYSKTAVNNIISTLNTAIADHIATLATSSALGHVKLSDSIRDTTHNADYGLQSGRETFAATPKAVADALRAANEYTANQIAGIAGAMLFKGTLGTADAYSTSTNYAVGDYCTHGTGDNEKLYRCNTATTGSWNASHWTEVARTATALPATHTIGWTYRIVAPGTYAGKPCEVGDLVICVESGNTANNDHWTVAQNNIDGAVTAADDLDADTLVLGNGQKTVKKKSPGVNGQFLKQGASGPEWDNVTPMTIGDAYGTASLMGASNIFLASLNIPSNVNPTDGSIVVLKFSVDVPAGSKIKIGSNSALSIQFKGADITAGVILAGDTATLMYETSGSSNVWHLLAVDRQAPTSLQGYFNDIIMRGTCATAAATTAKVADISANSVQGMVVAINFANDVPANATLKLNSSETAAHAIMHRGSAIAANAIRGGDTATLMYDASSGTGYWHLISIDRPFDNTPTSGSHNLVDSDAVYQAIENATLYWEEM